MEKQEKLSLGIAAIAIILSIISLTVTLSKQPFSINLDNSDKSTTDNSEVDNSTSKDGELGVGTTSITGFDVATTTDLNVTDVSLSGQISNPLLSQWGSNHVSSTFVTPTTATNTLCAVQNTGEAKVLTGIGYIFASSTSPKAGSFEVVAGTSTSAYVTSTKPLVLTGVLTMDGKTVVTPTSTIGSTEVAMSVWEKNEWLVWKANTTTAAGRCWATFF